MAFPPKPERPTKQLHWTKIREMDWSKTLWTEIINLPVTIDIGEIENTFSQKAKGAITRSRSAAGEEADGAVIKKPKSDKKEIVKLLDAKRAYGIDICLARFHMSHDSIRDAIVKLDMTAMDLDQCSQLMTVVPTTEEAEMVPS
jgi:hypothetical protein